MASYVPGRSPLQSALTELGAAPEPAQPASVKDAFDGIARQTSVPANVLIALDEAAGGKGSIEAAQKNAAAIAREVQNGAKIEDAISKFAGDDARGRAILERSYDIADELYSTGEAKAQPTGQDGKLTAGETAGGLARDVATGAVRGVGSAAQALGVAADEVARYGDEEGTSRPTMLRGAGKGLGDAIAAVGDKIAAGRAQDYQDRRAGTQISGDLTDPSSWSLGEDPSLIGLLGVAAEGIGSMAPLVAMPGPRAAAVFGGLMAGGEGAQNGRQFVEDAAKTLDENGRPEIERLPVYQALTDSGMAPADAVEEVARRAENNAGFRQGLIGSIGGAATNRIMRGAEGWLGRGGRLTRAMKKGAAGSAEEGVQEATEGAASATGINEATGADLNVMEQSFADFMGGALAGGGMGAIAGAALPGERQADGPPVDPATGEPLALPAPDETLALPAPAGGGTIFGRDERPIQMPGPDGSGAGQAAAIPDQSSLDQDAAATPSPVDVLGAVPPQIAPPAGPLEAIGAGLAASRPEPEPEYPPTFPDQKPGGSVRLGDSASGAITDAVFMGETPDGAAQVRINGEIVAMTPAEFDQARNAVQEIETARKEAEKAAKQAETKGPDTPGALSQAAMQNIAPPAQRGPERRPEDEMAMMEPDEARKALANLETLARSRGWNTRTSKMRDILNARIALGETADVQPGTAEGGSESADAGADDGSSRGVKAASEDGADQQEGSPAGQEMDQAGLSKRAGQKPALDGPVGGVDVADGAGKLANALTAARAAGQVTHTTKKGKAKTGYVLQGVTKAEADAIDAYSFKKDGGIFVNADRADSWKADALDGEIITPEDDARRQADAARASGFEMTKAPAPQSAPWWRDADGATRSAILAEAGAGTAREMRRAVVWDRVPEDVRRELQEAYGRLYRAGKIENAGTIEAPRPKLVKAQDVPAVSDAAREAAPEPTDAQKEAGNYKMGHARWNGLSLSIENAKGSERRGKGPDGKEWSVTMPADYGYFRGTEGADGDHVDFYHGGVDSSDYVMIVDQVDAETGKFDEHKVIIGTTARGAALDLYRKGFSDGKADNRIGAITETTVDGMKAWLGDGKMRRPAAGMLDYPFKKDSRKDAAPEPKPLPKPSERAEMMAEAMGLEDPYSAGRIQEEADSEGWENLAFQFKIEKAGGRYSYAWTDAHGKIISRMKGVGMPQAVKDGRYRDVLSAFITVSEARFRPAEAFRKAWEAPGEVRAPQKNTPIRKRPNIGDPDYTLIDAMNDLQDAEAEYSSQGMVKNARTGERMRKLRDLVKQMQADADKLRAEAAGEQAPKANWGSFDERSDSDPKMPAGYELTSIRRLTKEEAKAEGYEWPAMKAVVKRDRPAGSYAVESGISENSRANAIAVALERAMKGAGPTPAPGILGALSQEKQDRAAELKARLAAKARGQASSGLDPEYITLGGELVALYIEAGTKRFGQMLRDFAESTGLTLREAQAPMRAAYNHVRDDMDLNGEDVSDMDDAAAVMAEVRAALAEADTAPEASQSSQDDGNIDKQTADETLTDDNQPDERDERESTRRGPEADPAGRPESLGEPRSRGGEADARDDGPRRENRGAGAERGADASRSDLSRGSGGTDLAGERQGARNHVIPEGGLALPGGDKTRARNAVKAIETLRTLEREGRPATSEERQALSLYGGAGTLAPALPNSQGKIRFPDIAADLDRLLTDEERATVEKTSQYAFYTAEPVLRNMWNLAQQLGITGGQVFEPGMGVGGFAGTMPKGFFGEYTGIELDHITAKIAAALYPKHHIKHGDFIKTPMINDYYDLAIGNPPFARTQIKADPAYPQGFMIHDYFFAKSLDGVRPGGLLMFVTSAGTLNKLDSKARDYMADRADLVGAIRLPNTAFAENGTQVTTDIIVLRKRHEGEAEANPAWRESTPISVPDKDGGTVELPVNRYFQDHPEMILGEQGAFDTLVGRSRIGVRPREGSDLSADLAAAVARFPRKITSMGDPVQMMKGPRDANSGETKAGSYYLKDGEIWQFDGTEGKAVPRRGKDQPGLSKSDYDLIQDLIPMRDALRSVYSADLKGEDAKKARRRLNKVYDDFVAKRGPINKVETTLRRPSAVQMEGLRQQAAEDARAAGAAFDIGSFDAGPMIEEGKTLAQIARARREASQQPGYREGDFDPAGVDDIRIEKFPNIDAFSDDPENFRLRAIERFDAETQTATKSRVFTENAINMSVRPTINSPEDALLHLLAETGRVDLDRIAELSKSTPARVREELEGKIFENPATEQFETRAKYLSGNVRRKLREAEAAMRKDDRFKANADALAAVLPDPIPRSQIVVPLGAHWFDQTLYSDFAKAKGLRLTAEFKPTLGIWVVDGDKGSSEARNAWGTEDMPFADLMRRVMNNKALRVTRTVKNADGTTNTFVDEEATQAAADKAQEVKAAFQEWLWSDEDRANNLEEQYNDTFNSEVAPNYDGAYLTTPGVHSDWRWRPHQTAVIARILQDGSTYMAHTVGAGKTSAMIGAGMEARRLGLARKPWYVVPNHMLVQFATEFQHQYPLADILVADEKRFHTDRRKQFVADAATGEFDAVIITHSAFEKIPASEQAKGRVVSGILDDIREMVDSAGDTGDRGRDAGQQQATLGALNSIAAQLGIKVEKEKGVSTAKKIAQILEQAEQRLSKLTSDTRKDAVFDFDEIGVDMLFVDEAHLFRKLSFATTNGNIKGIDPSGSQASMDLFIKSRVVDERNPGRGLILASGTPITNTMAELYTLSRLMQPEALAERNISAFDAWAATFGEVASELEQTPDGGYKEVSRFSKFVNTPELSLMVRQIMDVVTSADLEKYVTRPKLKDGGRSLVVVESTEEQQAFQQTLAARMRAIAQRKGPVKKGDDILLSVINDGRLAAIDMRLVDPSSDGAGSKLERMIGNIYQRWKGGAEAPLYGVKKGGGYTDRPQMRGPSTQIVFSTLGIDASKHNPDFSVHRYIKAELVRRGVPADQIVLAKDLKSHAQKQRAFNDMNEGKKRILVGSKSIFTGVNAQKRIAALHNLDPLWYPADDEQRNGRGLRQGNMNPEIEILDYSTKGTYDATMWQMMARKASFIEAFYRGDPTQRDMEDLGEASQFEQAKAMTTRDPRVLELTDLKAERDKLRRRAGAVDTQRARLRGEIRRSLREMEFYDEKIERTEPLAANLPDLSGDKFKISIGRQTFDSRSDAGRALIQIAEDLTAAGESVSGQRVGNIGGFAIEATHRIADGSTGFAVRFDAETDADAGWSDDPVGLARRVEHAMRAPERRLDFYRGERARLEKAAAASRKSLADVKDFAQADELAQMDERISAIEADLLADAEKDQDDAKESRFGDDLTGDPALTPARAREINAAARAELEKVGIAGRVRAEAGGSGNASGTYQRGVIRIIRDRGKGWRHTLDHEIIHALRDGKLWSREYGIFTAEEWRALARAARADRDIRSRVEAIYPDLSTAGQTEEMVAELYADWAQGRRDDPPGPIRRAFEQIAKFFRVLSSVLRGQGFHDAATIMEQIAAGKFGDSGPDGSGGGGMPRRRNTESSAFKSVFNRGTFDPNDGRILHQRDMTALRNAMQSGRAKAAGLVSREFWQKSPEMFSNWLTDAMGRNARFNVLAAVPGHPLFAELGKNLSAAQTYLRNKQEMDAMRNDWQARASGVVDRWSKTGRKNAEANNALMDLMHKTTLAGIDPTRPDAWKHTHQDSAARILKDGRASDDRRAWARKVMAETESHHDTYSRLRAAYEALPKEFQDLYGKVRDEYSAMADAMDAALIQNIETASRIAGKRAERQHRKELERIRDEGLEGAERDEAIDAADSKLAAARKRAAAGKGARMASMRQAFESNRLSGPYFPLARFGNYFVTIRDADGKVVSFSRFEKKSQQDAFIREAGNELGQVERGVLGEGADLRGMVDPRFVADVEQIMDEAGASPEVLDAFWQHWLETLPDQSVRKSQIHRKGRAGFNADAIRAYSSAMFHGAHQLARLKYGLEMDENLNDAEEQAARQPKPERAGFVVREMRQRHNFTMKPTNNPLVTAGTSLAFIWYLGMSPASAMVNMSQTTIMGVPIMAARFKKAGVSGTADALWKAVKDFGQGKGHIDKAPSLTADERAALAEGYRRGTIDKTQAHDLASVAESGVEYSPAREKAMRVIGFLFHHTERFNREVTFLANYRLLRDEGKSRTEAIDEADALVKKIHFDYQNTARPRVMQGDMSKLLLVFRNFTVNTLYRLFRDTHQAFSGDTKEARQEARNQLVGISLSMMAHAGIKGVWGYGLIMAMLGMFFPGGDGDDLEEWLQDALLMEGDSPGTAAWNWTMGMALNGVPGNVMGVSLTNRIGMPNLWFQPARAGTEGRDLWTHYLEQIAGPVAAIPGQFLSGLSMMSDAWGEGNGDNMMRGAEKMLPGFAADALKPVHLMTYGANTYYGDPLIENVSVLDALRSALGFTPAKLAERYDINNRLKSREKEIMGRRSRIHKAIGNAMMAGEEIPASVMRDLQEFNREYPEYPITPETARASARGRARMKERNEFGVSLNPKLNDRLRGEAAPAIYG